MTRVLDVLVVALLVAIVGGLFVVMVTNTGVVGTLAFLVTAVLLLRAVFRWQ